MRIGLLVHGKRADAVEHARYVAQALQAKGVEVLAEDESAPAIGCGTTPFSQSAEGADVVIALGGDGTLLRGAQYALRWDAALLGINLGRLGFLAETEPEGIDAALQAIIDGDYQTETRPMLDVSCGDNHWYALNDTVVSRGGYARLITIDALVDGESSGRYVADGIVVATPTGSTGYSLSAGGPIIAPNVDCIVITPICPHTLQHRPSVVHSGAHIRLQLAQGDDTSASLQVDGQSKAIISSGDHVDIRMHEKHIRLIRFRTGRFFQLVREKLTEWTK